MRSRTARSPVAVATGVAVAASVAQGIELATAAGCADPATAGECLRSRTTEELLAADGGQHGFGRSYGGGVIPEDPARQPAAGETADVPVMHGITRDEHVTFQAGIDTMMGPVAPADHPAVLGQYLGVDAAVAGGRPERPARRTTGPSGR
jgi:para-nitrobenzyl esterase